MVALDRAEERGLSLQLPKHVDRIRPLGDPLGRCRTEIFEEGRFHEESLDVFRLLRQYLLAKEFASSVLGIC